METIGFSDDGEINGLLSIPSGSSPDSSQIQCDGEHFAAMAFALLFP